MNKCLVSVSDLHKEYREGGGILPVLSGACLEVSEGETVAIMGASGSGKSTLLHILGALDTPSSGDVRVAGYNLVALKATDAADFRNRVIGFVFQFHHLLMDFTVLENVMMPVWISQGRTVRCRENALELLEAVGLVNRAEHKPFQISGGERQRVAIARALMNRPKVLLADEPTGSLDRTNSEKIAELLLKLNKNFGLTLILATHNPMVAAGVSKCLFLRDGELHENSSV